MATEIERDVIELRKLESEVGKVETMYQDYVLKKHENDMVIAELGKLADGSKVYKMIGPALIPQDINEAKGNVTKRLEFIEKEVTRLGKLKEEFVKRIQEKQAKVMKAQQDMQRARK